MASPLRCAMLRCAALGLRQAQAHVHPPTIWLCLVLIGETLWRLLLHQMLMKAKIEPCPVQTWRPEGLVGVPTGPPLMHTELCD
jgi:hypothetical protein